MKKGLAIFIALMLIFALFSACDGQAGQEGTATDSGGDPTAAVTNSPSPTDSGDDDGGLYHLAKGNYEVDSDGVPTARYEYTLPLTTSDEVFTYWATVTLPQYLPEEGYASMPYPSALREKTGVNIEYQIIPGESRQQNFSVLLAADDLSDLMSQGTAFYSGSMMQAVEEGYFQNLFEYKDYLPNYLYYANSHPEDPNVRAKILYDEETIFAFWSLEEAPMVLFMETARGDWLDRLGMTNDDIVTMDDFHNMLTLFKTEIGCESPLLLYSSVDAFNFFVAYDTVANVNPTAIGPAVVDNGVVRFCHTSRQDFDFMTMIAQWYQEGLIEPDWMSYSHNQAARELITTGGVGVVGMLPSEAAGYEYPGATDPETKWVPLHKPVLYEGQVFHCGDSRTYFAFGSWVISPKCENIPLLTTYCDYFYSPEGVFFSNYGVEGHTFYYNEDGEPELTDYIINHPGGLAWAIVMEAYNEICEGGVINRYRNYAYPEGKRLLAFHEYWVDSEYYRYDASMDWPDAISFNDEQSKDIAQYAIDMLTYVAENYLLFVDGSKPLSEWDSYVDGLEAVGWNECLAIYQQAYDDFIRTHS